MKLMKRATALLLCFLMLASGPISAFATEGVSDNDVVVETTAAVENSIQNGNSVEENIVPFDLTGRSAASITAKYVVNFTDYGPGAGNDTTPGAIAEGDKFQLTLTLTGTNVSDESYTYTTPAGYVLKTSDYESESYDNVSVEGAYGATVSFRRDGDHSAVTFTFPEGYTDTANATVTLYGIFEDPEKADSADGTDDGTVTFPGGGSLPIYTSPTPGQTHSVNVYKDGARKDNTNGDIIFHYVIQVQAPDGALTDITVVDKPEEGMEILTDTVYLSDYQTVSYASTKLDTEIVEDSNWNEKTYKWTISEIPDKGTKYIHYDAKVTDTNKTSFSNEVTATAGDKSASSSENVYLKAPAVTKTGTKNGDTVTWTINITFNDFNKIVLVEGGDMVDDAIKQENQNAQYTVTYQPSGKTDYGNLVDWVSGNGITLTKTNGDTSATVTFDTKIPATWGDTHTQLENYLTYKYGNTSGNASDQVEVETNPRILSKEGIDQASDHSENHYYGGKPVIDWTINLSFTDTPWNLYNGDPKFADILLNGNSNDSADGVDHNYIPDSFKLYLNNSEVALSEYIDGPYFVETTGQSSNNNPYLTWMYYAFFKTNPSNAFNSTQAGQKAFYFRFKQTAPMGDYKLTYQTQYSPEKAVGYNTWQLTNAFFGGDNYEYKIATVKVPVNYITKTAGSANSWYGLNATESTVKWYISLLDPYVNNSSPLYFFNDDPDVKIVDTLPQGFELKSIKWVDSYYQTPVNVVEYDPDSDYGYGYGTIPAIYYTEGENNQITVTITDQKLNNSYGMLNFGSYLEIETEYKGFDDLTPGKTSSAFTNEAYIIVNDTQYPKVEASVTFTPPQLISKSIKYIRENAPRPEFTVEVNPNGQDLMNGDTITVRDVIEDTKQTFLPDTLAVYEGVGANKSANPVSINSYEVTVNETNTQFTITGLKDAQAYTITYRTRVNEAYDSSETLELKNKVYLDGVRRDMDGDGTVGDAEYVYAEAKYNGKVVLPSAMGTVNVNTPTVFVNKVDDLGNPLAGAEFTIYSDEACTQAVGKITSGDEGISNGCTLGETNTIYYMKETKAPEGYKLSELVWKFGRFTNNNCPEGVDNINGNPLMKIYEVVNEPDGPSTTSLTITKSGGQSGENFIMTVSGGGLSMQVVVPANGSVTIDGLTVGEAYTVTEDMNWAWRYSGNKSGSVILEAEEKDKLVHNVVTITNGDPSTQWLSGDSIKKNLFGSVSTPDDSQE